MKRILVTGTTGRLGKRVIQDLMTADYRVVAVSQNAERLQSLQSLCDIDGFRPIPCDLSDVAQTSRLAELVSDINVLVHLAGRRPDDPKDHATCTRQVIVSLNLIGSLGDKIDHAIVCSCVSVYGNTAGVSVATNYPIYANTYYGASQLAIEKFWNLFATNTGKPVTCLRFGSLVPTTPHHREATQNYSDREIADRSNFLAEASRHVLVAVSRGKGGLFNVYLDAGIQNDVPVSMNSADET
jgi:nucleoside-diphosphate-sugar epimerase